MHPHKHMNAVKSHNDLAVAIWTKSSTRLVIYHKNFPESAAWYFLKKSGREITRIVTLQYPVLLQQNYLVTTITVSLVPRPSTPPVFDRLQYAKTEGEGLGNFIT